ncbi:MAG: phosphoadenylyl-sulfate reductase [Caulobacterales bacterium]|nr:phosphoadenylyl-sulfate reductase [Caulobacterales bacterium]
MPNDINEFSKLDLPNRLKKICETHKGKIVFTSSLGLEDQLITHHIATQKLAIEIITLDTGRLFNQSHSLWQETEDKYGITIKGYFPNPNEISKWVRANGTNGFRNSIEARKQCCAIRKLEPLSNALEDAQVWITGLRNDASKSRENMMIIEEDKSRNLYKFNPLIDYTREQIFQEIINNKIPYNSLHDEGYLSIGCAPCTRAIQINEDERAGRWWWESEAMGKKECGLHINDTAIKNINESV